MPTDQAFLSVLDDYVPDLIVSQAALNHVLTTGISDDIVDIIDDVSVPPSLWLMNDVADVSSELSDSFTNGLLAETGKSPLVNAPYIRNGMPYGRPTPSGKRKLEFEKKVYELHIATYGAPVDPHTGEWIDWKPGEPRKGKVDFGHKNGMEYREYFKKYKNGEISLDEFRAYQFDPNNYQLEIPSVNRSHLYEKR